MRNAPSLPCSPDENGGLCQYTIVQGSVLARRSASSQAACIGPGALGVERDEVHVAPVERVPALHALGAAVLGQDEHLAERRRVGGFVLVVAAGREDREVLEIVGVEPEEVLLELGARAPS